MYAAAWLLTLPLRLLVRLGLRSSIVLACLLVLAVTGYGIAADLGLLDPPAHAKPRRARPPAVAAGPPVRAVPGRYLTLYRQAGRGERWGGIPAWAVLAGIGKVESDHGRSSAPGVRSGLNRHGCCAGPMQFNLTDGPPSTWQQYGRGNVYDPADAIPAAARKLRAQGVRSNLDGALLAYNRSWPYVAQVKRLARAYAKQGGRP
jgi:hypothetical protein